MRRRSSTCGSKGRRSDGKCKTHCQDVASSSSPGVVANSMHDDLNPGVSYRDQGLTIQALYVLNTSPNLARKPWTYGHDIRGREYLSADSDFEALVQELKVAFINTSDADVQFRLEPSCGKYSQDDPLLKRLQCRRASWTARLDTKLLDKFFNGLMGIRAQYYA